MRRRCLSVCQFAFTQTLVEPAVHSFERVRADKCGFEQEMPTILEPAHSLIAGFQVGQKFDHSFRAHHSVVAALYDQNRNVGADPLSVLQYWFNEREGLEEFEWTETLTDERVFNCGLSDLWIF